MAIKTILFVFALACFTEIYGSAPFSDCGSEVGKVISVEISSCKPTDKKCILKRNTNATLSLEFTSDTNSESITAIVQGVILGVPTPFPLPNPDGCQDSDITCPITSGKTYKYTATLPIKAVYPRVTVDIKWQLQDQNEKDIVCVLIPAKLS